MHVTVRSYLTAGVAVVGAGAIALSPIQPLPEHAAAAPSHAIESLAVNLASSIDPITPWVDTFKTSFANVQSLLNFYLEKPFPLLQTVGANIGTYFTELTNGNAGLIPQQIADNAKKFFEAPWWNQPGDPIINTTYASGYISDTLVTSALGGALKLSQQGIYGLLPLALTDEQFKQLLPILQFTATPYGGQLAGLLGPILSPVVQLTRSFTAIGEFFKNGDVIGAINELINIPANMTNAFLNGAGFLDLTGVVNAIQPLPSAIKQIGLNLGGLISRPVPYNGSLLPNGTAPTEFSGGTFFDAVAATAEVDFGSTVTVNTPGLPTSWGGAVIGLGQFLGEALVVTPPAPTAAAVAPKVAAALPAPAASVPADAPATPVAPAVDTAPAVTAPAAEPTIPAALSETPAKAPAAVADTPAPAHRGGGNDNGGNSGGHGHRGAA